MTTPIDVVRRVFPDATKEEAEYLLWNRTGFPGFWDRMPPERAIIHSLRGYKKALARGTELCVFCDRDAKPGQLECGRCWRRLNRVRA